MTNPLQHTKSLKGIGEELVHLASELKRLTLHIDRVISDAATAEVVLKSQIDELQRKLDKSREDGVAWERRYKEASQKLEKAPENYAKEWLGALGKAHVLSYLERLGRLSNAGAGSTVPEPGKEVTVQTVQASLNKWIAEVGQGKLQRIPDADEIVIHRDEMIGLYEFQTASPFGPQCSSVRCRVVSWGWQVRDITIEKARLEVIEPLPDQPAVDEIGYGSENLILRESSPVGTVATAEPSQSSADPQKLNIETQVMPVTETETQSPTGEAAAVSKAHTALEAPTQLPTEQVKTSEYDAAMPPAEKPNEPCDVTGISNNNNTLGSMKTDVGPVGNDGFEVPQTVRKSEMATTSSSENQITLDGEGEQPLSEEEINVAKNLLETSKFYKDLTDRDQSVMFVIFDACVRYDKLSTILYRLQLQDVTHKTIKSKLKIWKNRTAKGTAPYESFMNLFKDERVQNFLKRRWEQRIEETNVANVGPHGK